MPLTSAKSLARPLGATGRLARPRYWTRGSHNEAHALDFSRRCRDLRRSLAVLAIAVAGLGCASTYIVDYYAAIHTEGKERPEEWDRKPTVIDHNTSLRERLDFPAQSAGQYVQHDADHSRPGQQAPPRQTKGHHELTTQEMSTWSRIVDSVAAAKDSVASSLDLSKAGEKLAELVVPRWVKILPGFITKLQDELSMSPGSLAEEIWREANDPECNPEIIWDARVRISDSLCDEEQNFLQKRRHYTKTALARYLGVPEHEIHPDDVPVIAMCGSGGGLRALVAGTSSYLSTKEAGLFDCVTYTAGVSGSCWLQTLFYSSMGQQSHARLLNHLKHRLDVHIAYPPAALTLLSSAPTNKFLLSSIVEKMRGVPDADFGIVDVYGLLLTARLLVPKGELGVSDYDLKLSNQRRYIDNGAYPLPIYTAVRHEIPEREKADGAIHQPLAEAYFQWFEWTPYEFFCEEMGAGIPTWAIGRRFDRGHSVWRETGLALPEVRIPLLLGIWGSAFCATLSHYYKEIRPLVRGLTGFGAIDSMVIEKDADLTKLHPIDPASIPNFAANLKDLLPSTCPKSIHDATHLQLMDAGMSNNLPIYPLLRPGRDIDVVIAFDASADVRKDNWIKVTDGYVKQRGIKGWPIGAGWPPAEEDEESIKQDLENAQATTEQEVDARFSEAQRKSDAAQEASIDKGQKTAKPSELGYCTVWVGTIEERETDSSKPLPSPKAVEQEWEVKREDAGIAVIYFPFLANPKVGGVDPMTSDFMSTWNFVYTTGEIDKVVQLARANFEEGREQTKRTIRAVWERKRSQRLQREDDMAEMRRRTRMRKLVQPKEKVYGEHGDHFS
ncbi:hypothetical protein AAFC00_002230 [Neodothiora populina]|uniref:Lysophospholipase n=1 Tax=Neodothiora populina TaxID=2781224 RepID=A0ABR3PH03_9PEZI